MPALRDLSGQRFGRLTVGNRAGSVRGKATWQCTCDCGVAVTVVGNSLVTGHTASCGCYMIEVRSRVGARGTHKMSKSPEWTTYRAMHQRCERNARYVEKKITVCERWSGPHGFPVFLADMGHKPVGLTLDRINNALGYSPENCRWATYSRQARNRDNNVLITHDGVTATLADWADRVGIPFNTLRQRVWHGWSTERLLSEERRVRNAHRN